MKRKRRLTPIETHVKRKRRDVRSKQTPVETGKPKRTRKKPVKDRRIDSEFYICTKTLKDGNGKICFIKGNEYLLQRHLQSGTAELRGMVLRSEVWGEHLVYHKNWGKYFKKSKRVEKLTPEERKWVDPRVYEWQESVAEYLKTLEENEYATDLLGRVLNHMINGGDPDSIVEWGKLIDKHNKPKRKRTRRIKEEKSKKLRKKPKRRRRG